MGIGKYIEKSFSPLNGKTVAITGSTGGLGNAVCKHLCSLGASLILLDRNAQRSEIFAQELRKTYSVDVSTFTVDHESMESVKKATEYLIEKEPDVLICNAGAYSIPRRVCDSGYDNVFQINFISPYYMIKKLLPTLRKKHGRAVIVGSIAHNYSKTDPDDIDFSTRKKASLVYGNSKRYLMYSLLSLFKNESDSTLSVTHPGITFTNITAHYPKLIFALIKHPMKVIFMKTDKASLSIVKGVFESTEGYSWYGPKLFDIWGLPSKKKLKTASEDEIQRISNTAERIFNEQN